MLASVIRRLWHSFVPYEERLLSSEGKVVSERRSRIYKNVSNISASVLFYLYNIYIINSLLLSNEIVFYCTLEKYNRC